MSMDSPTVEPQAESQPGAVAAPPAADPGRPHVFRPGQQWIYGCCGLCGQVASADLHWCQHDRCQMLKGRQRSYASNSCRAAAYDQEHPRIAAPGVEPAGGPPIQTLIADLLADGRQRTAPEIAYEIRRDSATVARELRKLRAKQPRLCAVTPKGGHERARWFLRAAA